MNTYQPFQQPNHHLNFGRHQTFLFYFLSLLLQLIPISQNVLKLLTDILEQPLNELFFPLILIPALLEYF